MVALLTSVRNSPCFGGLRRTKTCHRQLFVRPSMLFGYFLHDAKSNNSFPFRGVPRFCKPRISAPQQLKPFKGAPRFSKPRISTQKQQIRTIQLNPSAAPAAILSALQKACPYRDKGSSKNIFTAPLSPIALFWQVRPARSPCTARTNQALSRAWSQ